MDSPEWKTFSELFGTIHVAIRFGISTLANQAFSRGLLTSSQLNTSTFLFMPPDNQADQFLAAIRTRIESNPESFVVFRDILASEPVYEPIVRKIDATLASHRPAAVEEEKNGSVKKETDQAESSGAAVDHIGFTFHDVRVTSDGGGLEYECFEPHKHNKKTKLELSFGEVQPKAGTKQTKFKDYEMKRFPHGLCLIINNEKFLRQTNREGTAIDEGNLVQTFRFLGYKVEVHRDRTVTQMEGIFEEIRQRDHSKHDSLICCMLTHGEKEKVYGSDSETLDITTITSKLNGKNCPKLAGKPKLFFLQACRGGRQDTGTRVASDSGEVRIEADSDPITIPDETDFFFGYATPPGKVAWRDLDHGSWYVSELCRSLCTHATYADLNHMIQEAHDNVATNYRIKNCRQAPEYTTQLRKDVYFF